MTNLVTGAAVDERIYGFKLLQRWRDLDNPLFQ